MISPTLCAIVGLTSRGSSAVNKDDTHQDASSGCLSRDEFAGPVLRLRHPAHLGVRCLAVGRLSPGSQLGRHGSGDRLLAEQPWQYPPRQHEQQSAEEGDEAGTEKRVPVRITHAFLVGQWPVELGWTAIARPNPGHACRRRRTHVAAVNHVGLTVPFLSQVCSQHDFFADDLRQAAVFAYALVSWCSPSDTATRDGASEWRQRSAQRL